MNNETREIFLELIKEVKKTNDEIRIENKPGFIILKTKNYETDEETWYEEVYETKNSGIGFDRNPEIRKFNMEKMSDMLYSILESLGMGHDKHDKYNLEISVKKNNNYNN